MALFFNIRMLLEVNFHVMDNIGHDPVPCHSKSPCIDVDFVQEPPDLIISFEYLPNYLRSVLANVFLSKYDSNNRLSKAKETYNELYFF